MPIPDPSLLAERLRALIAADGRTPYAISRAAGLRPAILARILSGASHAPTWPNVVALAEALHVSVAELLTTQNI